jgi:hypothetical protein
MYSRVVLVAAVAVLGSGDAVRSESIAGHPEPAYRQPRDSGHLCFYRTVTLRGVLTFEHHRKLEPPPEERYSTYVLRTRIFYSASYDVNARESYWHTGLNEFYVEAPRELSLLWYRDHEVEISGRLLPHGRFHSPTLIVDKISRVRKQTSNPYVRCQVWRANVV